MGAGFSLAVTGQIGMRMAVREGNVRVANAARTSFKRRAAHRLSHRRRSPAC
jgi:Na+/H+-translocating membrane pyrophosphatase